jgi:hypothetical protein
MISCASDLRDAGFLAVGVVLWLLITDSQHAKIGSRCPRDFQLRTHEEVITMDGRTDGISNGYYQINVLKCECAGSLHIRAKMKEVLLDLCSQETKIRIQLEI